MKKSLWKWTLVLGLLAGGSAWAQQEPTLNEIYATAQAGKLEQAQTMVQQVLVSHPNSAKAHYVRAELYARQGQFGNARESLAKAEKFAPGLPFAKPEAVQALRAELAGTAGANRAAPAAPAALAYRAEPAHSNGGGWVLPVLLAGGVIVAAYFIFRRRTAPVQEVMPGYGNTYNSGLNGPQIFGNPQPAGPYPGYGAGYPQPYGQPQGSGLGGKIMGGVATGLAVGAGVMAAEAIGRNLMGGHDASRDYNSQGSMAGGAGYTPIDNGINSDMGGADFGISDASSWDDPGSSGGTSSDWDN